MRSFFPIPHKTHSLGNIKSPKGRSGRILGTSMEFYDFKKYLKKFYPSCGLLKFSCLPGTV
jgi:hypothetical protein